ncbi:MAG TPA: sialidase family protein, partial [Candidatus Acidoferrum sp.]|nr:sialidase family protein [Candidatus Acidoferrum sp.]
PIYVSHDAGVTWTPTAAPTNYWIGVASSADGNILMASGLPGVCISTNGGLTWNFGSPPPYMSGCACSADGRKMVVGDAGMQIWTSTNTGVTWTAHNLLQPFTIIAVSADGDTLAAVCDALPLPVSLSSDFGMTWSTNSNPALYGRSVAASADGCRLFVVGGGQVYSLATTPQPVLKSAVSGNQLRFSWTVPSMPFVLQQNSDLTTTNWVPVTDRPVFNPSRLEYETTVTPVPGARFYRLAQ